MKGKIIFLSLLFIFIPQVSAKTYYSNYSDYSYQEQKVESNDTTKVEKVQLYKWYHENVIYGDYEIIQPEKTYDLNDFIEKESDWENEKPEELNYRKILERTIYNYKRVKPIKYVYIEGISNTADISEIEILKNKKLVDFKTKDNSSILIDQNDKTYLEIKNNDILQLELEEEVYIDDLLFKITFLKSNSKAKLKVILSTYDDISNKAYTYTYIDINTEEKYKINLPTNYFGVSNPEYIYEQGLENIAETKFTKVEEMKQYKYIDTLFKEYKAETEYMNGYDLNGTDYFNIKGEEKTFYRYKTRDKITISDNLTITDKNFNLNNFIQNSTIDNIKIISNIDMNVNGKYDIYFVTPFKTIKEEVIVDIKENLLNLLVTEIEENQKLRHQVNEYSSKVNNQNVVIKEIINNNNKTISFLQNELLTLNTKNSTLANEKKDLQYGVTKTNNKKLLPLLFLSIVIACIVVVKGKESYYRR